VEGLTTDEIYSAAVRDVRLFLEGRHKDLLKELRGVAWACAAINAAVCARYPPRLYVSTAANQPLARCLTRSLSPASCGFEVATMSAFDAPHFGSTFTLAQWPVQSTLERLER